MQLNPRQLTFVVGATLLLLGGCSGNGLKTIPVYGKVTVTGRAFPKVCRIYFLPITTDGPKRPAVAETKEDGSYNVKAFKGSEGLLPGNYKVNVVYLDLKSGADPALDGSWIEHKFDGGELAVDANSRGTEHNIEVKAKS